MRINKQSKLTVKKIHLYSGQTQEIVKEFFHSLLTLVILNFLEGKSTSVPFFGEISIKYLGDKIKKKGKQAQIGLDFKASDVLLRNIGQIIDREDRCDIIKLFERKIEFNIGQKIDSDLDKKIKFNLKSTK